MIAKHYIIEGRVQGVGFRYFVVRQARSMGLVGWVRNLPDGTVEAIAAGPTSALSELEDALRQGPLMSRVDRVAVVDAPIPMQSTFEALSTPR